MTAGGGPGTIQSVALDQIEIGERLRALRPDTLQDLAASIQTLGLINPITLVRTEAGFRLVAGRHRMEACRMLGWTDVSAIVVGVDELGAQLHEIDENLRRAELSILERGEHLVRRSEVLEALGQRARRGRPKKGATVAPLLATTADLAEAAGVSERTAQRYMQIARALPPAVRDVVRGTSLADRPGELEELAGIEDPDEQLNVASQIASGRLYMYYGIDDARRRLSSRICETCSRVVDREHLIDGKVVHGIGCGDDGDKDLEPLDDDELIDLTPTAMQREATEPAEPEPSLSDTVGEEVLPPPRQPAELIALVYGVVGAFPIASATDLIGELDGTPLSLSQDEVETLCRLLEEARRAAMDLEAAIRAAADTD